MRRMPLVLALTALLASACASGADGRAAKPEAFDREIPVAVTDALRFEPATIRTAAGETVKFVITNSGRVDHEFAIGSPDFLTAMSESARGHGGGHSGDLPDGGEVVGVPAGKTATLVFTMPAEAPAFECHVDRHDRAGMTGTITYT